MPFQKLYQVKLLQLELYSNVLIDAFSKFVPSKMVTIRPSDAPWCTNFTRLLLRKKNRQAGAELGQAQLKLGLDFNSINLN